MPSSSSPALLRLKSLDPILAVIPVIVVSATTDTSDLLPTPDVKAVLSKPTSVPVLLREVDRWARRADRSA